MAEATETGGAAFAVLTPRDREDLNEVQDAATAADWAAADAISEDGAVSLETIRTALEGAWLALRRVERRIEKRNQARERRGSILRD